MRRGAAAGILGAAKEARMSTHTAPAHLVEQLERAGIPYELIDHPRTTTAAAEARVLGVDAGAVAKTVVLETPDGFVRTVVPASARLDLHKVGETLGTKEIRLATEEVLAGAYPEFELGAVPPLTGGDGDRVLVDRSLLANEWVVLEAGTHEQSVRLRAADLVAVTGAAIADLSLD
jgi:Ala-tRNA(Pro) deacylase